MGALGFGDIASNEPSGERSRLVAAAGQDDGRRRYGGHARRAFGDGLRPPSRLARGMVVGMATRKVTITLDEDQVDRIRALVEAGTALSVSGFVQHAVGVALDDVAGWGAMLADALGDSGGELSREERRWADEVLGVKGRAKSPAA